MKPNPMKQVMNLRELAHAYDMCHATIWKTVKRHFNELKQKGVIAEVDEGRLRVKQIKVYPEKFWQFYKEKYPEKYQKLFGGN